MTGTPLPHGAQHDLPWTDAIRDPEFGQSLRYMRAEDEAKPAYIYAIRSGAYIKVGLTLHPEKRMKTILSVNPDVSVVSLRTVERRYVYLIEKRVHRLLAESRLYGEWFEATNAEVHASIKVAINEAQRARRAHDAEMKRRDGSLRCAIAWEALAASHREAVADAA